MKRDGFTIAELMSVLGVACIMAAIAIPSFITWLPNVRLKGAARELYSNMQLAKTRAMKTNADWAIVFDTSATPGTYSICSGAGANGTWEGPGGDDAVVKTVQLSDYNGSVDYGPGSAGSAVGGGALPGDNVGYDNNAAIFDSKGMVEGIGYVYLANTKDNTYAVGTPGLAGAVVLRRWADDSWE